METSLTKARIEALFGALDEELRQHSVIGELYVVGGAVLCVVLNARPATRDVDAYFEPTKVVRDAAARVAARLEVPENWLNDAAKGFLVPEGTYTPFLELANLRVLMAQPEYLLAMKCLAFRLGAEFHDEADVRYLLRYLNIDSYANALEIITRYYPRERFPQKAFHALEEILGATDP